MARKASAVGNIVYYMDSLGRLHSRDTSAASATWQRIGNPTDKIVDFAALPSGKVYGINGKGEFFTLGSDKKWTGPDPVIKHVESLEADSAGNLWLVNSDGAIYRLPASGPVKEGPAVPTGATWTYTVKPNDHLSKIVRNEYHVPEALVPGLVAQIVALNKSKIPDPDVIAAGLVLTMPPR